MTASMAPQGPAAVLQGWRRSGHGAGVRAHLVPVPCMGRARVSVAVALWHWPGRRAQAMAARVPEAGCPSPALGSSFRHTLLSYMPM